MSEPSSDTRNSRNGAVLEKSEEETSRQDDSGERNSDKDSRRYHRSRSRSRSRLIARDCSSSSSRSSRDENGRRRKERKRSNRRHRSKQRKKHRRRSRSSSSDTDNDSESSSSSSSLRTITEIIADILVGRREGTERRRPKNDPNQSSSDQREGEKEVSTEVQGRKVKVLFLRTRVPCQRKMKIQQSSKLRLHKESTNQTTLW